MRLPLLEGRSPRNVTSTRTGGTHKNVSALTFVPFDAFWIVLAALLVTLARILVLLRSRHQETWEELGCPTLLPHRDLVRSAALTRFYWSRRALALGDPELCRWVVTLRVLQLLFAAVLIGLSAWLPASGS